MYIQKNSKIIKWIVLLPIIGISITTILLILMYIKFERDVYAKEIDTVKSKFLKESKTKARERIDNIVLQLEANEVLLKSEAKREVQNIIKFAITMITNEYSNNKHLSHEKILEKIKERLRGVRFFENLSGYFFVYDLSGKCILLPTNPELENTNLYDLQDATGKFTIREQIEIVKQKNEGFLEWYWYKPDEKVMKKKIGFVELFEPLGIYIGIARYEEDIIAKIKDNAKIFLENMIYADQGYIFAYDGEGNLVINSNNPKQFQKGSSQVSQIIRGSKIVPEGFFISHTTSMQFDANPALEFNSSFVRYMQTLDWVIGINTYGANVLKEVEKKEVELQAKMRDTIFDMALVTFFIVLIVLVVMLFIANKLKQILGYYQEKLILRHNKTKEQKKLLQYQVKHDTLTSLPNRVLLTDRLKQLIKRANRENYKLAVVFIDVDKFKSINDTHGHHIGDMLLCQVATRLKNSIRQTDIVARLSGDEFIIVLDACRDLSDIIQAITKIKENFETPFLLENTEHTINLSIGVSVYPQDGKNVDILMKNADTAMLKAKEEGRDTYKFFTKAMDEEVQEQLMLEKELKIALKNNEFVLYYQPIVNSVSAQVEGLEALIRWQHPTRGLVLPNDFIAVAEESHLIVDIGSWVTKETMTQVASWYAQGLNPGRVSINFAGKQLEREDLYEFITKTLEQTGCKPEWIGVEVVERFIMKNPQKSIELLKRLRNINIGISIDDFGTGYSSLSYLKQLPITKLKIDRTFVKNISESFEDRAIAKTIIALGTGLYLKVLAEGVETQEQRAFFIQNGCTQMQGYLFSKPLDAKDILAFLKG